MRNQYWFYEDGKLSCEIIYSMWFQLYKHFIETAACVVYVCVSDCAEINPVGLWLPVSSNWPHFPTLHLYSHTHTHTHTETHPTVHTGKAFAHAVPSAWNAFPSFPKILQISKILFQEALGKPGVNKAGALFRQLRPQSRPLSWLAVQPWASWVTFLILIFSSVTLNYTNCCLKGLP